MSIGEKVLGRAIAAVGGPLFGIGAAEFFAPKSVAGYVIGGTLGFIFGILFPMWVEKNEERNA